MNESSSFKSKANFMTSSTNTMMTDSDGFDSRSIVSDGNLMDLNEMIDFLAGESSSNTDSMSMIDNEQRANRVEFLSDKPIENDQMDVILLFLESRKRSGGGEILAYTLDESTKRRLMVTYKSAESKENVMAKKVYIKLNKNLNYQIKIVYEIFTFYLPRLIVLTILR